MREVKVKREKTMLIFKGPEKEKKFVLEKIERSLAKLKEFFNLSLFPIKIYLVSSRKEFEKLIGRNTASWQVGNANCSKNKVYLLSPLVFEKESIHKRGDFPKVLTHELSHLFVYKLYPFYEPRWLIEGLAYYIAGQGKPDFKKKIKLEIKDNFLSQIDKNKVWRKNLSNGAYQLSFLWVDFLIENFGKEKILKLMKKINFLYDKMSFVKTFEQVYQQNLNSLQRKFLENYFFQNPEKKGGEIKC